MSDSNRTTTLPAQVAELAALLADTQARLHLCEQSRQEWIAECRRLAEMLPTTTDPGRAAHT